MPKISVIIPAYNVERYLSRCLDSVMSQTFKNFEVIVVDDGSSDKTGEICDKYAVLDKRINVIHKKNEGVSAARNAGIEMARGDWCCFIDSDDWVEPKYLENFSVEQRDDCQLIMQSFIIDDEIRGCSKQIILPDTIFNEPSPVVDFLEKHPGVHNGFIWHRLFRLCIVKNKKIRFPSGISYAEDGWFFFDYMKYVVKTACSSKIGNHYIIRKGTLTSTGNVVPFVIYKSLLEHYIASLLAFDVSNKYVESHVQMVRRLACRLAFYWCVANALSRHDEYEKFVEELKFLNERYDIYKVNGLALYHVIVWKALGIKIRWLQRKIFRLSMCIQPKEDFLRNYAKNRLQK